MTPKEAAVIRAARTFRLSLSAPPFAYYAALSKFTRAVDALLKSSRPKARKKKR